MITGLVSRLASAWEQESLARKAIALLGPGVPDIYQGTEWFEDSLVDPDNRRPVDYRRSTDHPKVRLVQAALGVRSTHAAAFGPDGDYRPILAEGPASDHVIAFGRGVAGDADPRVIVATSRFTHSLLPPDGAKTMLTLPPGDWVDAVSGATHSGSVSIADLRAVAPVAILTR